MSVHGVHASAILSEMKTVELRRKFPNMVFGTRVWIYETLPEGAVVGFVTVVKVERAPPPIIWQSCRNDVGIDYSTFARYFHNTSEAVAIMLSAASRILPITTHQMREIRTRFHPPQVAMRLTSLESAALRDAAKEVPTKTSASATSTYWV